MSNVEVELNYTISCHCSLSILPANIRRPLVFRCFQGVQKETSGIKWIKKSSGKLNVGKLSSIKAPDDFNK